jgi:hypothetical protein
MRWSAPTARTRGWAELSVGHEREFGDDLGARWRLVWVGESYRDYVYPR